jgi:NAD(P)-dependent dehydrogenase (short-subunit alcohol dehydrogenase family)
MLSNKVVLITGATSGIGAATALVAARAGAKVVLAARRQEMGDALVERIKVEGGDALFVRTDVTVEADIQAMVERTVQASSTTPVSPPRSGRSRTYRSRITSLSCSSTCTASSCA